MQIFQQFKQLFILLNFIIFNSLAYSEVEGYSFKYTQKLMDADWNFMPDSPPSFQSSKTSNFELGFMANDYGVMIGQSELNMDLLRSSEPKDVSLSTDKVHLDLFYRLHDSQYLLFSFQQQKADEQVFDCYSLNNITLGNCDTSDLEISSTNPQYDYLNGSLLAISGETKSIGLDLTQELEFFWLDKLLIGVTSTKHEYDWLTPLEEIKSPFILGLVINENSLEQMIQEALNQLPQRDPWRLNQINLQLFNSIPIASKFQFFYAIDLVYLDFKSYRSVKKPPKSNAKLNIGILWQNEPVSIEIFSNLYLHNLIGFEPITFNQRTEHYFNKKYGELGVALNFRF